MCLDCGDVPISPGLQGPQGPAGTNGLDGTTILYNNVDPSLLPLGTVERILMDYTMPANTLTDAGDLLEITGNFNYILGQGIRDIHLYFGDLSTPRVSWQIPAYKTSFGTQLKLEVTRVDSLDQIGFTTVIDTSIASGNFVSCYLGPLIPNDPFVVNLSAPVHIRITGKSTLSMLGAVVANQLLVKKFKKV